jgi:hypothetical protein
MSAARANPGRTLDTVRVTFVVHDPVKRIVAWEADLGKRRRVPGTLMGGYRPDLPHDLAQYVVEAATTYQFGFWGLVARGATFRSTGRKRTKPGRALIAEHRAELQASEHLANLHLAQWRAGLSTPVTGALETARRQWNALAIGDALVFEWPSARGELVRVSGRAEVDVGGCNRSGGPARR